MARKITQARINLADSLAGVAESCTTLAWLCLDPRVSKIPESVLNEAVEKLFHGLSTAKLYQASLKVPEVRQRGGQNA